MARPRNPLAPSVPTAPLLAAVLLAASLFGLGATEAAMFERSIAVIETEEGAHRFDVELAVAPAELSQGLMHRETLDADAGMLFDFGRVRPASMWMENTLIPLDMLFLDEEARITHIAADTTPLSRAIVSSDGPVRGVLEVPGGTAERLGIEEGDRVLNTLFGPAPPETH